MQSPAIAAEHAARDAYGRLLAYLSARSRDVAAAEDALADAFRAALETWPRNATPDNPEAWLLSVARRRLVDAGRRNDTRAGAADELRRASEEAQVMIEERVFPDERLKLLFICAHPAIDPAARTALMLQTVLGVDAARIASAFLVSPDAMAKRLVRAKARIREAGLRFEEPRPEDLPARLDHVLEAVYAAFGLGWDDGREPRRELAEETVWLARLLPRLLPREPEAHGLLALVLHCEARSPARRTVDGAYVPLSEQDVGLWSRPLIEEAEAALRTAAGFDRLGRFQLEAAIQSAHAERAFTGRTPWPQILAMYEVLLASYPTLGAMAGRAAALLGAGRAAEASLALDAIPAEQALRYQPFWAVRARVLQETGCLADALAAYDRAIGLSTDDATRRYLAGLRSHIDARKC